MKNLFLLLSKTLQSKKKKIRWQVRQRFSLINYILELVNIFILFLNIRPFAITIVLFIFNRCYLYNRWNVLFKNTMTMVSTVLKERRRLYTSKLVRVILKFHPRIPLKTEKRTEHGAFLVQKQIRM